MTGSFMFGATGLVGIFCRGVSWWNATSWRPKVPHTGKGYFTPNSLILLRIWQQWEFPSSRDGGGNDIFGRRPWALIFSNFQTPVAYERRWQRKTYPASVRFQWMAVEKL